MNFFTLMRAARFPLMAEAESGGGGGGGGEVTTLGAAPAATPAAQTPATNADPLLSQVNADNKTVGELEAEASAKAAAEAGETPEAKAEREAAEAKAKLVPETYEAFKLPEGVEADEAMLGEFSTVAKELNLTQDQAQKLVDLQAKSALAETTARNEMLTKALDAQKTRWAEEIKNDPELGGSKFDATVTTAVKAVSAFFGDDVRQLLNDSGIGNHPGLIRGLHKIGLAITEDRIVIPGSDASATDEKSAAEVMFGEAFKK
jgi:hypothetical protein